MTVTPEMLSVVRVPKPPGPVPEGLKNAVFTDGSSRTQATTAPALAVGGFTFWPMSYGDNRMSFGIVSYDPKGRAVKVVELKGARYVHSVTIDKATGAVTFSGQDNKHITLSTDQIYNMLIKD